MAKMDEATRKRVRAGRLMPAGKTPAEAAKAVGVARQTAYTWKASARGRRHRSVARHGNAIPVLRYDLLWEIHRLQEVARQAQAISTVARVWGVDKPFLARLDMLDSALFAEPCLWERPIAWSTDEEQALKRLSRGRR